MKLLNLLLTGALTGILSGCTSVTIPENAAPDAPKAAFRDAAEAFAKGDYARLERKLSAELRRQIPKERFRSMLADLQKNGKIIRIEYVTNLRQPVAGSELWKLTLSKKREKDGTVHTDKLLRIISGNLDGRPQIIGLVVQ